LSRLSEFQPSPDFEEVTLGFRSDESGVREVRIAGLSVGPVWFAQRSDDTFRQWLSQMMDRQVEGAVGGSAFKHLRMVIDYPGARAYFKAVPVDAEVEP
jgi:hypothetical protein